MSSGSQYGPLATKDVTDAAALRSLALPPDRAIARFGHVASAKAYGSSKLANSCFARSLDSRLRGRGVAACSLHPGTAMRTNVARESKIASFFLRRVLRWFTKDLEQGAATTLYCALLPHAELQGRFYDNCAVQRPSELAGDAACDALWAISAELAGVGDCGDGSLEAKC